ncbi:hypothetical protein DRN69_08810 [Candidatus Pacearchaeota archaeon]|nr:MAG: hypothetical protein DRN69_08810 [Candidatus Pacearchaeota archaeon]
MWWEWLIVISIILFLVVRAKIKKRGYFWKAKDGSKLTFKEFMNRWKSGIEGVTPLQQKKIALLSYLPIFAGIIWGIVVTIMGKVYWLTLILCGSLPITTIQFISTLQQYSSIKKVEEAMKNADISS